MIPIGKLIRERVSFCRCAKESREMRLRLTDSLGRYTIRRKSDR
jgi:hypothetical protein